MHFTKMNGAGNDFVVFDNRAGAFSGDLPRIDERFGLAVAGES